MGVSIRHFLSFELVFYFRDAKLATVSFDSPSCKGKAVTVTGYHDLTPWSTPQERLRLNPGCLGNLILVHL